MLGADPAIPTDQECDRQSQNSSIKFTRLCIAHHHGVIHFEAPVEVEDRFWSVIHGNADDLQAPAAVLILQFDEMRDLVPARIAPRCPKVQQYDLAPRGGKSESLSRQVGKREIGRQRIFAGAYGPSARGHATMTEHQTKSCPDYDHRQAAENPLLQYADPSQERSGS